MSMTALNQVYDEVRRLMIAGSDLAADDFRLRKLVAPLRKSAAKAPVFGRVADSIEQVLGSTPTNSAQSLLDLSSLVTSILYTQGQTGIKGALKPLQTQDLGLTASSTSARVLKPLIDALTNPGSGRLEIIRDAHARGGFKDLRLVKPAIRGIDDPYGEIADFVCDEVLPIYGKAIFPELKASFDPKGKVGAARRLRLMHKLDPGATRDVVDAALEDGSKDVKVAAVACLQGRSDALDFLIEQSQARTKDVRRAAFESLATFNEKGAVDRLLEGLQGKEPELVAPHLARHSNKAVQQTVIEELERHLELALNPPPPASAAKKSASKKKKTSKTEQAMFHLGRLHILLSAVVGRTDKAAETYLLKCFEARDEIARIGGSNAWLAEELIERAATALLENGSKAAFEALAAAGPEASAELISYAFVAASQVTTPKKVFDTFSPVYLDRPTGRTKQAQTAHYKAGAIARLIQAVGDHRRRADREFYGEPALSNAVKRGLKLDPRWMDAALEVEDTDYVMLAVQKKDKAAQAYLVGLIEGSLAKRAFSGDYNVSGVLHALASIDHPQAIDMLVETLKKVARGKSTSWYAHTICWMIPDLPAKAIEPLEAIIPSLQDGYVLDTFAEQLDELKRKHTTA